MDRQTAEAIENLAPVLVPTAKLLVDHQLTVRHAKKQRDMELDIVEKKKEMQQEAAETLKEAEVGREEPVPAPSPQPRAGPIAERLDGEDCQVCRQILEYIDSLPEQRRQQGIAEYDRLKATMETAESEDEVRQFIAETDIVSEALT